MYTNRFISLFIAISLLAVVGLVVRNAYATTSLVTNVDSASRSYTAWAKAAEASTVDSATLSYIAQAKALACDADATSGLNLDSATRSYIAWGSALQAKNDNGALCR